MEIIKETVERTVKETTINYKAVDGTIFTNEEECKRYEDSVEAVLLGRLKDIQINEIDCEDFFDSPINEGVYRVVVPNNDNDITVLNQLWSLYGGHTNLLFDKSDINTLILVGIRFIDISKIDWIWFYKPEKVIESVTNGKYKIVKA